MGKLAPFFEGEKEGYRIGMSSDIAEYQYSKKIATEKVEGEWLFGCGIGFHKGQLLRIELKKGATPQLLAKRAAAVELLISRYWNSNYQRDVALFLENIHNWESKWIPNATVEEVKALLSSGKLQQATAVVADFYSEKKQLIACMEYNQIPDGLQALRRSKQLKEITKDGYLTEMERIAFALKQWIGMFHIDNKK